VFLFYGNIIFADGETNVKLGKEMETSSRCLMEANSPRKAASVYF
jgi:hypothetical protein